MNKKGLELKIIGELLIFLVIVIIVVLIIMALTQKGVGFLDKFTLR
ncbi:MAG: hypothetical protein ABIB47_05875 [Candidatus Woesearchaeota archaeon]